MTTGALSFVRKIHVVDNFVVAFSGYIGLASIFLNKWFTRFLRVFPVVPCIDLMNVSDEGDSATVILADSKKVRVYCVENKWKRGIFNLIFRKKIYEIDLETDVVFSIGSGSSEEINKIAQQYSPEEAIKYASSVDKYTNDIITKLDIRKLFGM